MHFANDESVTLFRQCVQLIGEAAERLSLVSMSIVAYRRLHEILVEERAPPMELQALEDRIADLFLRRAPLSPSHRQRDMQHAMRWTSPQHSDECKRRYAEALVARGEESEAQELVRRELRRTYKPVDDEEAERVRRQRRAYWLSVLGTTFVKYGG